MALKKPVVVYAGELAQLQAGDTLDAPTGGVVSEQFVNDEATALLPGHVLYMDADDGCKKARADAGGTSKAIGLAAAGIAAGVAGSVALAGSLALTTGQWDAVFGTTGGLTFGSDYYLSPTTAGQGTPTAPSTVGQYVVFLGTALSTTELLINIDRRILL